MNKERVSVLRLSLHGTTVGHLAGYHNGRNVLTFDPAYADQPNRPTFTLTTLPAFPGSAELLKKPWNSRQRLHPVLSNLLPEGALREWLAQILKIHPDNEFPLFAHLGQDLPGALVADPLPPEGIPPHALEYRADVQTLPVTPIDAQRFSLAGVQMKFSMQARDGRYRISPQGELGDWIVKTPSTLHRAVPLNEYTAMTLASLAGIDIPEIKLVALSALENLPGINLPDEEYAYAIRRFDRDAGQRVHTEDFAQVFAQYPHDKYRNANYEQIGEVVYRYTGRELPNALQLARRLLVNILLGNGDAHLKNWTLMYPDTITPELAPAYDIVFTRAYIPNEQQFALNLGKNKHWYRAGFEHFQVWAARAGIPWRAVEAQLKDTLERARTLWPSHLQQLPMADDHKAALVEHWRSLSADFRVG